MGSSWYEVMRNRGWSLEDMPGSLRVMVCWHPDGGLRVYRRNMGYFTRGGKPWFLLGSKTYDSPMTWKTGSMRYRAAAEKSVAKIFGMEAA